MFLALFYSLFSSMIFLRLYFPLSVALFMLMAWPSRLSFLCTCCCSGHIRSFNSTEALVLLLVSFTKCLTKKHMKRTCWIFNTLLLQRYAPSRETMNIAFDFCYDWTRNYKQVYQPQNKLSNDYTIAPTKHLSDKKLGVNRNSEKSVSLQSVSQSQ